MEVSDYYYSKKSGQIFQHQIPAFGDWDKAKDLPITQYFETARQAGLIRYSSSSGESGPCPAVSSADLYTVDRKKPQPSAAPRKGRVREKRHPHVSLKDQQIPAIKKQQQQQGQGKGKVFDVSEPGLRKVKKNDKSLPRPTATPRFNPKPPKPVDEDLYKIPPELLHSSKRNKMKGLFSRCLVPACS